MTTDHRAEAESIDLDDPTVSQVLRVFRAIGVGLAFDVSIPSPDAPLADRCPDPAAPQAEDTGEHTVDQTWFQRVFAAAQHSTDMTLTPDDVVELIEGLERRRVKAMHNITELEKRLAEARAAGTAERDAAMAVTTRALRTRVFELRRALGEANELLAEARAARPAPTDNADLREQLAAIEHERWAHWQRYLHSLCGQLEDGSLVIPADKVKHWERQIGTRYADLSEQEKASDREQVDRYWHLVARPAPTASESGTEYGIQSGWLVEYVDEHTCGTGPNGHYGRHEPGCGTVPVAPLADLLARAARPAPMPPEVVAVVEAAIGHVKLFRDVNSDEVILQAVRALPEGWRDGAAPAAVPAELDPAGVERVARLLAEQRGVPGKQYDTLPSFTKTAGIERARHLVRAYLGDTDTGSEG